MKQLKEQVYDDLYMRILEGKIAPHELIKENALIEYYGVSRAPVREALVMLCSEGILRSIPRSGYQIILLTQKEERDIMQYRIFLECGALKENWKYIDADFIQQLRQADGNHNATTPDPFPSFWNTNIDFHTLLISRGGNVYATDGLKSAMRKQCLTFVQYIWDFPGRKDVPRYSLGHEALLKAIEEGDYDASTRLLEEDILNFRIYDRFLK